MATPDDMPVVLLIHGAGMDGTVWRMQTDYLVHHGTRAVAIDLPGHGRSEGPALGSIVEMADWFARFAEEGQIARAHLVGHSMGTFVALEVAARHPALAASLTLCGTAAAMPVHPDLLHLAEHDLPAAAALMAKWGHATPARVDRHPAPQVSLVDEATALVSRSTPGVLLTDLRACMAYDRALEAAAAVACPATVVIGLGDKMTPPKAGHALAAALHDARVVELADTGHSMMTETPRAVRQAILDTMAR